jgi:beta-lactamase class A
LGPLEQLDRLIALFDGDIRLFVRTYDGRQLDRNADVPTCPMSVIKLAYLHQAFEHLDMGETVTVPADVTGSGTGILCRLNGPVTMPMLDMVTLMIIVSDNVATDYVLGRLDRELMERRLKELGMAETYASKPFWSSWAPPARDRENVSTPRDICALLEHIRCHEGMREILAKQLDRTIIQHFLPADVKRFTKSGQHAQFRHDAGFLEWKGGGTCMALFGVRNAPATNPRELLEYDMQLAPIAREAYLWARGVEAS